MQLENVTEDTEFEVRLQERNLIQSDRTKSTYIKGDYF
jgi:hypothetical protein